jgi:hypothetical protein
MDWIKVIMDLIGNDLVREVSIGLIGVFSGGLGLWIYLKLGFKRIVKEEPVVVVNKVALLIYKWFLSPIKDGNLKNEITKNLDTAGDSFNDAWDKGIRGIRI